MKLTKEIRATIWARIYKATLGLELEALNKRENDIATKVREQAAGKHLAALDALPENFVRKQNYLTVRCEKHGHEHLHYGKSLASPNTVVLPAGKIAETVSQLFDDRDALKTKIRTAEANYNAIAARATTTKRLIELWPEIEPYAPADAESPAASTSLAIPINDLNKTLGLPTPANDSKTKKAA
ncbi:Nmad5 family putative nucleotide modification protein [Collimonas humicola]|uniref:Nmad5 family putative nucleotide modification protein n=1 Tax=Collimonas humicola TaxID=2825886 RepID=UPI001B8ABC59|nr:Nmad5 family putative nucleotide modification protein [Collimonas humicola]